MAQLLLPSARTAKQWRNTAGRAWIRKPELLPVITEKTTWLRGSEQVLSHIPLHIAQQVADITYPRFDALRIAVWKAIAGDVLVNGIYGSELLEQGRLTGRAPRAPLTQQVSSPVLEVKPGVKATTSIGDTTTGVILDSEVDPESLKSYVLHHKRPIHAGGGIYDLSNLAIVTPLVHTVLLSPGFHYEQENMPPWKAAWIAEKIDQHKRK